MSRFEVHVGNVGCVYNGNDERLAHVEYNEAVELSKKNYGRLAGESVTLWEMGEPIKEYIGSLKN